MSENVEDDLATANCLRILSALVGKGVEFGLPDTPVARFEWICCLILMASYIATKGESPEKADKIIDYVSKNRNLLLESPAYSEDELKHILDYRRVYFCSLNTTGMAYVLAELIDKATKYGHFVRLKSGEESQVSKEDFDSLKSYRLLEYVASDEKLASLATSLTILSDPLGAFQETIAEKTNIDDSQHLTPDIQKSALSDKKLAIKPLNDSLGTGDDLAPAKGEVATAQFIKITTMLTDSSVKYGLPNTSIAMFELQCYIICRICDVVTGGEYTELTDKILDYVSSHRELLPNSPNYVKSELKDILAYRLGMYEGQPIAIAVIVLGRMIDAANRRGHLTEVRKRDYELIDGGVDSTQLTPFLSNMLSGSPCVALSVFLLHNINPDEAVRFAKNTFKGENKANVSNSQSTVALNNSQQQKKQKCSPILKPKKQLSSELRSVRVAANTESGKTAKALHSATVKKQGDGWFYFALAVMILAAIVICTLCAPLVRESNRRDATGHNPPVTDFNNPTAVSTSTPIPKKDRVTTYPQRQSLNGYISPPSKESGMSKEAAQDAMWKAVIGSDEDSVKKAVAQGADVNHWKIERTNRFTALQYSVGVCDYEMTECLISLGADVLVKNSDYPNLWSILVRKDLTPAAEKIIMLLVDKGLNPNEPGVTKVDEQLKTQFRRLADKHYKSAPTNDMISQDMVDEAKKDHLSKLYSLEKVEMPILKHCATCDCKKAIAYLLNHGAKADVDKPNSLIGGSALSMAARKGNIEIMTLLLSHGARVDEVSPLHNATPLHFAVSSGQYAATELLLKHGASVNRQFEDGTALHTAALSGDVSMLELLLKYGASVNLKSKNGGFLPLRMALMGQRFEAAKLLIERGSQVSVPDEIEGVRDDVLIVFLTEEVDPMWKGLLTDKQWKQAIRATDAWVSKTIK